MRLDEYECTPSARLECVLSCRLVSPWHRRPRSHRDSDTETVIKNTLNTPIMSGVWSHYLSILRRHRHRVINILMRKTGTDDLSPDRNCIIIMTTSPWRNYSCIDESQSQTRTATTMLLKRLLKIREVVLVKPCARERHTFKLLLHEFFRQRRCRFCFRYDNSLHLLFITAGLNVSLRSYTGVRLWKCSYE